MFNHGKALPALSETWQKRPRKEAQRKPTASGTGASSVRGAFHYEPHNLKAVRSTCRRRRRARRRGPCNHRGRRAGHRHQVHARLEIRGAGRAVPGRHRQGLLQGRGPQRHDRHRQRLARHHHPHRLGRLPDGLRRSQRADRVRRRQEGRRPEGRDDDLRAAAVRRDRPQEPRRDDRPQDARRQDARRTAGRRRIRPVAGVPEGRQDRHFRRSSSRTSASPCASRCWRRARCRRSSASRSPRC